jgi:hypothetical protein
MHLDMLNDSYVCLYGLQQVLHQSTFCKMRWAIVFARFHLTNLKWALNTLKSSEPEYAAVSTTEKSPLVSFSSVRMSSLL